MAGKLLSEMTKQELEEVMKTCRATGEQALREGAHSLLQVLERRYYLALSYWRGPDFVQIGRMYGVEGETGLLRVESLRGVMAFGRAHGESKPRGVLIGMLIPFEFGPRHDRCDA